MAFGLWSVVAHVSAARGLGGRVWWLEVSSFFLRAGSNRKRITQG